MGLPISRLEQVLQSTSANATGAITDVSRAQLKSIQFICSAFTSGSGAFVVEVSNDGTNWVTYNRLNANVTNSNSQTDTRTAAPTMSSATSSIFSFPTSDIFKYIRVSITVTGTGTYSANLFIAG